MEYSIKEIVKKVLIVEHLEYLVGDKIKLTLDKGDIIGGEILNIDGNYLQIRTFYFGTVSCPYEYIKNIRLIEK